MNPKPLRIALLFGSISPEHEISVFSASKVAEGLIALNQRRPLEVQAVYINQEGRYVWGPPQNDNSLPREDKILAAERWEFSDDAQCTPVGFPEALTRLSSAPTRPDVALLILHGIGGEDGKLQAALELADVPYTGSGPFASALALDKSRTQAVLNASGLPIAPSACIGAGGMEGWERLLSVVGLPCVVKPVRGGSSVGITIVREQEKLHEALELAFQVDDQVMVEKFIPGREFTCGLVERNGELVALPVTEIVPVEHDFYDYEAKYAQGGSRHIVPAEIDGRLTTRIQQLAKAAHQALGCRGFSRVDFIADAEQTDPRPVVLEVNTIPGMTATSLLPEAAAKIGIDFPALLELILDAALRETPHRPAPALRK